MAEYKIPEFNYQELMLYQQFNNSSERKERHINSFLCEEKAMENIGNLNEAFHQQLKKNSKVRL